MLLDMKELLLITIGLFVVLMLFRFIRGVICGRRLASGSGSLNGKKYEAVSAIVEEAQKKGKVRDALREVLAKANSADASTRSIYHCAAGNLSLFEMKRTNLAVGFYLRALRDDPYCIIALDRLHEILMAQKRHRRLEKTCWDILSRLDDDAIGTDVWVKCWTVLASVYSMSPKFVRRADAIRKLLSAYDDGDLADDAEKDN